MKILSIISLSLLCGSPFIVAADTVYVSSPGNDTVMRFDASGVGSVYGHVGSCEQPVFDTFGNLYAGSFYGNTITKIAPGGQTSIFASSGFDGPTGAAFDGSGNLYVS